MMGRGEGGGVYNNFQFLLEVLVDLKANGHHLRQTIGRRAGFRGKMEIRQWTGCPESPPCQQLLSVTVPLCWHLLHVLCCCQCWLVLQVSQVQSLPLDTLDRWVYSLSIAAQMQQLKKTYIYQFTNLEGRSLNTAELGPLLRSHRLQPHLKSLQRKHPLPS